MIDRYLKDTEVTIHDDFKGTFSVPYQDSIGEIVNIDNDIELLNMALKKVESYSFFVSNLIIILKDLIYVFSGIFLSILLNLNNFIFLAKIAPIIGIVVASLCTHKSKKEKEKKIEGLNLQRKYILDEISKKKGQKAILERNRSKDNFLKEEVIVLDTIAKKKALLQKNLELLMNYKMNQELFLKNFDKHTLGNIVDSEEDKKFIQEVIIKEIRR